MEKSDATRKRNAGNQIGEKIVGRKMDGCRFVHTRCTQEARKKKREINRRLQAVVVERNTRDRENRQQREGGGGNTNKKRIGDRGYRRRIERIEG